MTKPPQYIKPTRISLKDHAQFNERWVQDRLAEDPSLLGLGDVIVKDKERIQPHAGRLELLLQDADYSRRYEVEIQLGKTDESHIIRTVEYWDVERRRYPNYEHVAVIVAEDITSRFLNVISLFNRAVPFIALQMQAFQVGDSISLMFTKVLDLVQVSIDEEEEEGYEPTDRAYWEQRTGKTNLALVDELLDLAKEFDPSLSLKYNKFYIGPARNGQADNFVIFRPRKNYVRLEPKLERTDEMQAKLEDAGVDVMDYNLRESRYRIRLAKGDVAKHRDLLLDLMKQAFERE
jgi:hypothetical protein